MFVCLECGRLFEDPACWQETHGFDYPPYEERSGCPYCYGSYAKTYECDCCSKWIVNDHIKIGKERYCQDCYTEVSLDEAY